MSEQTPAAPPAQPNFDPFNEKDVLEALKEENEDLLRRTKALIDGADKWEKVAEIKTDEQAERLTTFLAQISNITGDKGTGTTRQKLGKSRYTNIGNAIYNFYKEQIIEPLDTRKSKLRTKLVAYLAKKKAAADAEEARLRAEAEKLAATATTAAQVEESMRVAKAAGVAGKNAGVTSDFGQGAHLVSTWKYRVVDINKVPIAWLQVNETLVNKAIKGKNGLRQIPGLEIYEEKSAAIRT